MMHTLSIGALLVILVVPFSNSIGQSAFSLEAWRKQEYSFKLALVKGVLALAQKDNVTVRLPPEYYVREMDHLIENTIKNRDEPAMKTSAGVALKTIAVMDCDWDNGRDRLEFAREFMGESVFNGFKKDYPEKYQKLAEGCR